MMDCARAFIFFFVLFSVISGGTGLCIWFWKYFSLLDPGLCYLILFYGFGLVFFLLFFRFGVFR